MCESMSSAPSTVSPATAGVTNLTPSDLLNALVRPNLLAAHMSAVAGTVPASPTGETDALAGVNSGSMVVAAGMTSCDG